MAETLTVDTTPDTQTADVVENLTPEEQDSLQVGEEIQAQQETLLAGKYRSAEELEKAYGELQRKLGEKDNEDSGTTSETEVSESNEVSQEKKETSEDTQDFYLADGNVNYDSVNNQYGKQLGNIFKESNVDPWAINNHFHNNNGTISDEHYAQLENAGLARDTINTYLDGVRAEAGYANDDLTARQIDSVRDSVGGEAEYSKLVTWASQNLPQDDIDSFDSLVGTGNVGAIKLAVNGLKSQYENANGYEGRMLTGKAAENSRDTFRSQAQLVEAMSDPRYDNDPAFRQDVIDKLDRSDMQF